MHIEFNYKNLPASDALETHAREAIDGHIGRFSDRITRVEVHFADLNSTHKHGHDDKRVLFEARPTGMDPLAVESVTNDFHTAVTDAANKLQRVLTTRLEKAAAR